MLFPERLVFDFEVNRVAEFHAAQTATAPLRSHWEIRVGLLRYSLHVMSEGMQLFLKKQENQFVLWDDHTQENGVRPLFNLLYGV
jgi:hypothetical protein